MASPAVPDRRRRRQGLKRDLKRLAQITPRAWPDLAEALVRLAGARLSLLTGRGATFYRTAVDPTTAPSATLTPDQAKLVDRIAFAIPRVARRLPWRSDCVVQALAARSWLARHRVESALIVGVRKPVPKPFEAHAWLKVGEAIVIGGDISGYAPLGASDFDRAGRA
jgi:hypothetical protein